ncbi:LysM peptidoglycan-binding domain-containing protein [Nocardioides sp. SR21]|uniref:LysM peptidoglycan-binding domain-containing protein n=1 Tax=Nocardioides sp. SR21 TaxID=2919501 RepID=UPI001FA963FE|nr:LysM peptidoglycan-binding domain-containing protein [Nocardioides sp. SR21]
MSTITLEQINWTPAPRRGTVRLTRRGRLVVFVIALLAVLTVGILLAQGSVATGEKGTPAPTRVVMVGAGDTLWDIASGIAADGDVRGMMQEIEDLNALESSSLAAGQKLRVPVQ